MAKVAKADQPSLFETQVERADLEKIVLFGLGEFQARGFELAGRRLPLDRLRGAIKRAAAAFGTGEPTDDEIAGVLNNLGATVQHLPGYVAKHPFRVTVNETLAALAAKRFREISREAAGDEPVRQDNESLSRVV